ncbi:Acetophenone carboxylase gamma subunit [Pigmentiphaga humi]|uniref:Acetophenone carboxylase gamma subunit n=1 Tax=Pigmentiphaga humi TaxID=2478468 RepID=A0A3P4B700_9BURK|nr:hydantoinase/oxoprolinase family protein [Pigmentiphaga humi]VCU72067.1 Acetophenone carboxylase gamma subunit [Pigmentiphaga humi]
MLIIGTDTGGTFTDLAAYDADTGKVVYTKSLTTYDNFVDGVLDCAAKADLDLSRGQIFKHGTTLVINALIQRNGARTALVMTRGFRDVLEMGRGNRPEPFDLGYRRHPPLVPRELRYEIAERVSGKGEPLVEPSREDIDALARVLREESVESVAISFLHSYQFSDHEKKVADRLREQLPGVVITHGAALSSEWYEFERTATAAANAYVGPQVSGYLGVLDRRLRDQAFAGRLFMMGSNGGVLSVDDALAAPVALVESGPVGGSIGAAAYARELGIERAIAFDMGGTTAKCAVVQDGEFDVKSVYYVGGYERGFPIRGAVIDIVEVGAGGGSIAYLDDQQRLHVGPRSAGSTPGPVAYGRGGTEPTVTDANLALGRIKGFLGGAMQLDADASRKAIRQRVAAPLGYDSDDDLDAMAEGIIAIASVTMANAIKRVTVEKGLDPREYTLFAFGGGGPLHAVQLARQLAIPMVIVPPEPGNFSAVGMLLADARIDSSTTFVRQLDDPAMADAAAVLEGMRAQLTAALQASSVHARPSFSAFAEIRYRGQVHSIRTPLVPSAAAADLRATFESLYRARYGHADPKGAVEIVNLTLAGLGEMDKPTFESLAPNRDPLPIPSVQTRSVYFPGGRVATRVYKRAELGAGFAAAGPALIEEYGSTTVVGPRDRFEIGRLGEIRVHLDLET